MTIFPFKINYSMPAMSANYYFIQDWNICDLGGTKEWEEEREWRQMLNNEVYWREVKDAITLSLTNY
jgi:hypothetical protein